MQVNSRTYTWGEGGVLLPNFSYIRMGIHVSCADQDFLPSFFFLFTFWYPPFPLPPLSPASCLLSGLLGQTNHSRQEFELRACRNFCNLGWGSQDLSQRATGWLYYTKSHCWCDSENQFSLDLKLNCWIASVQFRFPNRFRKAVSLHVQMHSNQFRDIWFKPTTQLDWLVD